MLSGLLMLAVALLAAFAFGPSPARADDPVVSIPTPPTHHKVLSQQPDGTYSVTLSVKGETDFSVKEQYADVLVVMDTSSSMTEQTHDHHTGGQGQRIDAAKASVNMLADTLFGQNTDDSKVVNMALISFNKNAQTIGGWTNNKNQYKSQVNQLRTHTGTNWEAALKLAKSTADARSAQVGRPVYVIFVTDGIPTQRIKDGGAGVTWDTEPNCYQAARPWAKGIVDAGYKFYSVGIYGNINNLQNLTNYAYTGRDNGNPGGTYYYSAQDTPAFQAALSEIAESIKKTIAYKAVSIHDAINTASVSYVDGAVQPDYTLTKALADGTTITYDSSTGGLSGGSWNYELPTFSGNSVSWNPEANGNDLLTDGATYSITFKVKPTQAALDAMANGATLVPGDNDDDGVNESQGLYSNDNDKAYVTFSTVTTTTHGGQQTSVVDGPTNSSYNKPVIAPVKSSLTVQKSWAGDRESDHASKVVTVQLRRTTNRNGSPVTEDYGSPITLDRGNGWSKTVDVPAGLEDTEWSVAEIDPIEGYDTSYGDPVTYAAYGTDHTTGDTDGVLAVTNTLRVYDLIMYKTSSTNGSDKTALSGAEFTVFGSDGVTVIGTAQKTDSEGKATFSDLRPGTYIIRETSVPAGYQKLGSDLTLVIDSRGKATLDGVEVSPNHQGNDPDMGYWFQVDMDNHVLESLPNAGGAGVLPFLGGGAVLVMLAVSSLILRREGR